MIFVGKSEHSYTTRRLTPFVAVLDPPASKSASAYACDPGRTLSVTSAEKTYSVFVAVAGKLCPSLTIETAVSEPEVACQMSSAYAIVGVPLEHAMFKSKVFEPKFAGATFWRLTPFPVILYFPVRVFLTVSGRSVGSSTGGLIARSAFGIKIAIRSEKIDSRSVKFFMIFLKILVILT